MVPEAPKKEGIKKNLLGFVGLKKKEENPELKKEEEKVEKEIEEGGEKIFEEEKIPDMKRPKKIKKKEGKKKKKGLLDVLSSSLLKKSVKKEKKKRIKVIDKEEKVEKKLFGDLDEVYGFIKQEEKKTEKQYQLLEKVRELKEKEEGGKEEIKMKKAVLGEKVLKEIKEKDKQKTIEFVKSLLKPIRDPEEVKPKKKKIQKKKEEQPKVDLNILVGAAKKGINSGHSRDDVARKMKERGWSKDVIYDVFARIKVSKEQLLGEHIKGINEKLRGL